MRFIIAAALIASSFTPLPMRSLVGIASAQTVDGKYCELSSDELRDGWTCEVAETRPSSSGDFAGQGGVIFFVAIDPSGAEDWQVYISSFLLADNLDTNVILIGRPWPPPTGR
jgi:hypothetical protein